MSREAYIYPSAKVRVLERHLLSDADMTRVIDAKNPDIAFKAFNSLDYAGELLDLEAKDYRVAMSRKMSRLKKVFEKIIPDETLLRLLFLERDYYNIKILLKEKLSGSDFDTHLETTPGLIPVEKLRRYIIDELDTDIDPKIKNDINELRKTIGDDADPERIENLVDARLNRRNRRLAEKTRNKFIIDLYKMFADKNNLSIFLRARRLQKGKTWAAERLNDFGRIPASRFMENYEVADDTEFVTRLKDYFSNAINEGIEEYLKDKQIWHLEQGINNAIVEHLKSAKLIGYGPEVVVAYYFGKKFAIKNLSTIMALKFGEIEPTTIRKHLVNSY